MVVSPPHDSATTPRQAAPPEAPRDIFSPFSLVFFRRRKSVALVARGVRDVTRARVTKQLEWSVLLFLSILQRGRPYSATDGQKVTT